MTEKNWGNELKKLVVQVGEGLNIAELSEKSANIHGVESELFFEAHEVYDVAKGNPGLFKYEEDSQKVFLK